MLISYMLLNNTKNEIHQPKHVELEIKNEMHANQPHNHNLIFVAALLFAVSFLKPNNNRLRFAAQDRT